MYKPIISRCIRTVILSLFLLTQIPLAGGQNRISSPYSIFGVGELMFNKNIRNMGMGGIGVGVRDNTAVNDINPASYTAADSLSFIFEATLFSHFSRQTTETQSQTGNYTSIGNLSFGFPITRRWAAGFGLRPFSALGYKITDRQYDDILGATNLVYDGKGGLNQVFIGQAFSPFKGLSIGANASYLFGNMQQQTSVFSDSLHVFVTSKLNTNQVNGWHLGLGMQYEWKPDETSSYTLGLTYGSPTRLGVNRSELIQRILPGTSTPDTISYQGDISGDLLIPVSWGAGLFAHLNSNWGGGIDFSWQNWEAYELLDQTGNLNNTWQFAAGVQHNPNVQTFSSFFRRVEYRAGFRYGQTYHKMHEQSMDEFGMSFGVGLPIRRTLSAMNISFEFSRRGNTGDLLIRENFYRFNIGINIHDRWFLRRRFF